jgi:hypothetical protein
MSRRRNPPAALGAAFGGRYKRQTVGYATVHPTYPFRSAPHLAQYRPGRPWTPGVLPIALSLIPQRGQRTNAI